MTDLKDVVAVLGTVKLDLQWIIQVGRWLMGAAGAVLCVLLPLIVTLLIHLSELNARMVIFDAQLREITSDYAKLIVDLKDLKK